ncbi:B3 domain-containing transcription factor VRN1-like [Cornus florida]|uniref:B3 domain-containing transcription factor VRN1-like n=1 Tax=Cornus florida TaxID=4283 RepID=UPI00289F7FB8|nr:B3 domain-containing transcription factor VRN1-like [Cornus florida]
MASSSRRRIDDGSRRSSVGSNGPQFFKIIHNGIADDRKLRIPREFTKKYGKHLSNLVFLKVPTGAVWKVELVDSDGAVWLQNGWQEFREYYSIGYGHFLVFRYVGNSHFHVLIFDMSASEIEYPVSATHGEQTNNTRHKVRRTDALEVDDSLEILDGTCKTENTSIGIQTCGMKLAKSNADWGSNCLTREIKTEECTGDTVTETRDLHTKNPKRRRSISDDEKFSALQRAKDYKSEDPFIVIFMQPSYVTARTNLSLPLVFAQKYFAHKQNIILRVSDGRTWSVKCSLGETNAKLNSGWKSFVQDNHLKVGDVCVFQLIKGVEPSLKVIIF